MNNKDEFCQHIKLCENAMYSLAFSIVRNDADAGEVLSESIFRAYKNLHTLKSDKLFKCWILCIVHNTAVEMIRKSARLMPVEEMEDVPISGNENEIIDRLALRDAVEKLKQPYRTVVVLFYFEDLSIAKISRITGANICAVKQQLSRARKMLRESLKGAYE